MKNGKPDKNQSTEALSPLLFVVKVWHLCIGRNFIYTKITK